MPRLLPLLFVFVSNEMEHAQHDNDSGDDDKEEDEQNDNENEPPGSVRLAVGVVITRLVPEGALHALRVSCFRAVLDRRNGGALAVNQDEAHRGTRCALREGADCA